MFFPVWAGRAPQIAAIFASSTPTAPAQFGSGDWSVSDDGTSGDITISITALPSNGGSAITALEYQIDGGSWVSLGGTTTGDYPVSGLTDDVEVDVAIRAVNAVGASTASATKAVTPTAAEVWLENASAVPTTDNGIWTNYNIRQRIASTALANVGGSKVRVTFKAPVGGSRSLGISSAYIGHMAAAGDPYDFEAAPTQLFFGGNAGVTSGAGSTVVSDEATFSIASGKDVIISFVASNPYLLTLGSKAGWSVYYRSGGNPTTVDASSYTTWGSNVATVSKVESVVP